MNEQELDKKIDNALNAEPSFRLSSNFADHVVRMAESRKTAKETSSDGWWLAAGIVGILCAFIYAIVSVDFKPGFGAFAFLSGNSGLVIFGVSFIVLLNIIDKFLRKRTQV